MLLTNYAVVAKRYDLNRDRLNIEMDTVVKEQLEMKPTVKILDLACGTGIYMSVQNQYYASSERIKWHGLDQSEDMLAFAQTKVPSAEFRRGKAEEMPYPQEFFDYVVCNFAFHHFLDKEKVLDNLAKVIAKQGVFRYHNIFPDLMRDWWIYHFCPETLPEDMHRFWQKDLICHELNKRGFETRVEIKCQESTLMIDKVESNYLNRDNSQLAMIDDDSYQRGLEGIRREKAAGRVKYRNVYASIDIWGRKT